MSIKHIEFDGKNFKEIEELLSRFGVNCSQDEDGKITIDPNGKNHTLFKDDIIIVDDNSLFLLPPIYSRYILEKNIPIRIKEELIKLK